ncbi:MAG: SLBB domain-containing protein [Armatimonadetes bacterium]|nr:SLBB domain-containing protein [Armatimonadota bacterium]
MKRLLQLVTVLALVPFLLGQRPAAKIAIGDFLTVVITTDTKPMEIGGVYEVLVDGAIYGPGFGRLSAVGKTVDQAQSEIRVRLSNYVKPKNVFLYLSHQKQRIVYVVGQSLTSAALTVPGGGPGALPLQDKMTLRQALGVTNLGLDVDLLELQLFRDGRQIVKGRVSDLLSNDSQPANQLLEPNDVITVLPIEVARVWVSGIVRNPGRIAVPAGSGIYEALTASGGLAVPDRESETKLVLHRGDKIFEFPTRRTGAEDFKVESGDSLSVVDKVRFEIEVGGEVAKPGSYVVDDSTSVLAAITKAGGPTKEGTLQYVLVKHGGETNQYDISAPVVGGAEPNIKLQSGDLVYVRRNEKVAYVFGLVNRPGRLTLEDRRDYRATDALALAGGIANGGGLRRVYLLRTDKNGKYNSVMFNLDEYLKDGKIAANPEIHSGDALFFTDSRSLPLDLVTSTLSSLVLITTLFKK